MTDEITNEELTQETETAETETQQTEPTPEPLTIMEKVKLALRISHNLLNGEINDVITSAREELKRAGVSAEKADSNDEIIETAIKTYALAYYATTKDAERYEESFKYQCDCLRKSFGESNV